MPVREGVFLAFLLFIAGYAMWTVLSIKLYLDVTVHNSSDLIFAPQVAKMLFALACIAFRVASMSYVTDRTNEVIRFSALGMGGGIWAFLFLPHPEYTVQTSWVDDLLKFYRSDWPIELGSCILLVAAAVVIGQLLGLALVRFEKYHPRRRPW